VSIFFQNEIGIIVIWLQLMCAEVHHFTTCRVKFGDQLFLQFKPAMIGCDAYAA